MLSKSFFVVRIKKLEKPLDKKLLIKKLSRRLDRGVPFITSINLCSRLISVGSKYDRSRHTTS